MTYYVWLIPLKVSFCKRQKKCILRGIKFVTRQKNKGTYSENLKVSN